MQDLIPSFLQRRAADVDEGWDWNQTMQNFQAPHASQELESRIRSFKSFMSKTLNDSNDETAKKAFYGRCTWEDVQNEAAQALALYKNKGRSWRHPFRTAGRVFSNSAYRIDFLIQLLPDGEYTFLLKGCLNLAYNAAKRFKYLRETVFHVFDSLSETIEYSEIYIKIYIDDGELRSKAEALFTAILGAVEAITDWINHNPAAETFKSFFQQDDYGKSVEDAITTNLEEKGKAFDDRVRACLHTRIQNIHKGVVGVGQDVQSIGKSVEDLSKDVGSIKATALMNFEKQKLGMERLEELLSGIAHEAEWARLKKKEEELEERQQRIEDQVLQLQQAPQPIFIRTFFMSSTPSHFITSDQLQQCLNASSTFSEDDLILEFGDSLQPRRKQAILWVIANDFFQNWLQANHSGILIISAMNEDVQIEQGITPLSCVCALLKRTLHRLPSCTSLNFYCGTHASPGDNLEGANGIIRSLTYQILQKYGNSLNLSFLDFQALQQIQNHDLQALCVLFRNLFGCIGTGVFVCIIDEVSLYETDYRLPEMEFVMTFLNNLVTEIQASSGGAIVLKILVTTSALSDCPKRWFPGALDVRMVDDDYVGENEDRNEMHFLEE